jgi:hypothetical protein
LLQEFFGERIVGRGLWPPRSPNLPRRFLFGFLKERVYSNNPRSLEEQKHNIEETVANTDLENFAKSHETHKKVDVCGRHFQHLL